MSEEYGAENITWESQNSSSSIWSPKEGLDGLSNSVQIEGRGSTGRTVANTLEEQLAMEQVKSNPLDGAEELSTIKLGDPRWDSRSGWVKMSNTVELSDGSTIEIHFLYNKITGFFDDFKFKDY